MSLRILWKTFFIACFALIAQINCSEMERTDNRRPIWNIGHMVNSIKQADEFLGLGANAIETDVTFDSNGKAQYAYHGTPCDCFRDCERWEYIDTFIRYIRNVTTSGRYRKKFILMMWDLKISSLSASQRKTAGKDFAKRLINNYWTTDSSKARVYMILGVPSVDYANFISSFRSELERKGYDRFLSKIGYDFSGNEDLKDIEKAFNGLGFREHVWLSDGITNCATRSGKRLEEAIRERESGSDPFIDKVYSWTYDYTSSMKYALLLGVDGLITNNPNEFLKAIRAPGYRDIVRLATYDDNPFERKRSPSSYDLTKTRWEKKKQCIGLFEYKLYPSHYRKRTREYHRKKCDDMFV